MVACDGTLHFSSSPCATTTATLSETLTDHLPKGISTPQTMILSSANGYATHVFKDDVVNHAGTLSPFAVSSSSAVLKLLRGDSFGARPIAEPTEVTKATGWCHFPPVPANILDMTGLDATSSENDIEEDNSLIADILQECNDLHDGQ